MFYAAVFSNAQVQGNMGFRATLVPPTVVLSIVSYTVLVNAIGAPVFASRSFVFVSGSSR